MLSTGKHFFMSQLFCIHFRKETVTLTLTQNCSFAKTKYVEKCFLKQLCGQFYIFVVRNIET